MDRTCATWLHLEVKYNAGKQQRKTGVKIKLRNKYKLKNSNHEKDHRNERRRNYHFNK